MYSLETDSDAISLGDITSVVKTAWAVLGYLPEQVSLELQEEVFSGYSF